MPITTSKTTRILLFEKLNSTVISYGARKEQKIFIEAAPQFKSLNFYDGNMKRVNAQTLYEKQREGQTQKQEAKKESVKQDNAGDEEGEGPKQSQKKSRKKGLSVS